MSSCSNDNDNSTISPQLLSFEATAVFKFDSNGDNERDSFVTDESTFKNWLEIESKLSDVIIEEFTIIDYGTTIININEIAPVKIIRCKLYAKANPAGGGVKDYRLTFDKTYATSIKSFGNIENLKSIYLANLNLNQEGLNEVAEWTLIHCQNLRYWNSAGQITGDMPSQNYQNDLTLRCVSNNGFANF